MDEVCVSSIGTASFRVESNEKVWPTIFFIEASFPTGRGIRGLGRGVLVSHIGGAAQVYHHCPDHRGIKRSNHVINLTYTTYLTAYSVGVTLAQTLQQLLQTSGK